MSELYEKSLLKLELDKVLEQLAACAGSQEGKEACLRLRPTSDLEDVQALHAMSLHGAIIGKAYYTGALDLKKALEVCR